MIAGFLRLLSGTLSQIIPGVPLECDHLRLVQTRTCYVQFVKTEVFTWITVHMRLVNVFCQLFLLKKCNHVYKEASNVLNFSRSAYFNGFVCNACLFVIYSHIVII